jgi:hypothetical protein
LGLVNNLTPSIKKPTATKGLLAFLINIILAP